MQRSFLECFDIIDPVIKEEIFFISVNRRRMDVWQIVITTAHLEQVVL